MNRSRAKKRAGGLPVRYLLVFWILVLSAVAYLDRTNISIAGVQIGAEFGVDNTRLGWVFSAFLIGYAAFQIPSGVLVRRFGPRRLLAFGVIWWAVFTALTALVPPGMRGALLLLVLVRIALGAGEAVMYPSANQFVERWFPIVERGKANGIIFGGVGIGSGLTPPLLTAIILHFGWRASFWFCAVAGLLAGTVWYLAARDTPEKHPWVTQDELDSILRGREDASSPAGEAHLQSGSRSGAPWRSIFTSKEVLAVTASYFAYGYVAWIYFSWFYIYLSQVRGMNLKASALYSMFPFIAMTLGSLIGGVASDWLARRVSIRWGRCILPAFALGCTALLLVAGSKTGDPRLASAVLACGAGALYLSQSCFWSVSADFAGEFAGVVSGTMNMGGQIGGAVTASLTPLIASVLAALGGLAWLIIDPHARLVRAPAS